VEPNSTPVPHEETRRHRLAGAHDHGRRCRSVLAEAIVIAPAVLPPTKAIFGRASARGSHRLYYHQSLAATAGKATLQFKDPTDDSMLLELRVGGHKGAQSVFPGSVHETGEPIGWEEGGEPAQAGDDLVQLAKFTAALCISIARRLTARRHFADRTGRQALAPHDR
jgi:hypothetical protein